MTTLLDIEASHISVEPMPGAVAVRLKRDRLGESASGRKARHMMIELTLSEAFDHYRRLGEAIRAAGAHAAALGPDSAPPL